MKNIRCGFKSNLICLNKNYSIKLDLESFHSSEHVVHNK